MALSILPASVHTPREVTRADTGTREGSLHAQWALIWSPPAMATCSITLRMTDIGPEIPPATRYLSHLTYGSQVGHRPAYVL